MTKDVRDFVPETTVEVKAGTVVGSTYAQIVGISVTDTDLTLEFVFVNPRPRVDGKKEGQVVSRVTLPINAGLGLANVITETINQHIKKRSGKKQWIKHLLAILELKIPMITKR